LEGKEKGHFFALTVRKNKQKNISPVLSNAAYKRKNPLAILLGNHSSLETSPRRENIDKTLKTLTK
jgi:hypothetical protein